MNDFNGENLRIARQYNGLTVEELAKRIDVSTQAVSQYEMGKTTPQFDKLVLLSDVLHFPSEFFFKESKIKIKSGASYFRSLMKTPKKYRTEQKTKVSVLARLYTVLSDYIEFPGLDLPSGIETYKSPEEAANYLRQYWNLGDKPIKNILRLLESKGLLVTSFETPTRDIDAFSQYFNINGNDLYLIAYSSNKNSAARINFDLAHELGHIMLHPWSEDNESISREQFKLQETEANEFASAFLLPEVSFRNDAKVFPSELNYYKELKKKWYVSMAAMIRKSCTMGIISSYQYQYMMRTMTARNIRVVEPLDDILEVPYPRMLKDAVEMLVLNNVFTKIELMQEFGKSGIPMNGDELEKLFVLEKGYFDESGNDDMSPFILRMKEH